jgi:hypothetical protein
MTPPMKAPMKVRVDDVLRMRKPHPCGGFEWVVVRIGADIGIRCLTCGRKVMLPRAELEKRVKATVSQHDDAPSMRPAEQREHGGE